MENDFVLKKLLYDADISKELFKTFPKYTQKTIYNALNGAYVSQTVMQIRKRALDLGAHEKGCEQVDIL